MWAEAEGLLLRGVGIPIDKRKEGVLVRLPEILLILLSIVILVLAGFGPLFGSQDRRRDVIPQECEMFYGPSGRAAVSHCMNQMLQLSAGNTR
jgi:hypothetical protein